MLSSGTDKKGSNKICEHFSGIDENKVSPRTQKCEECEKEGTDWVALRMCLVCGHVGCCDSSEGLHATRHFKQAGHPVMIALPNKPWKWCYVHKKYIINCNTRDLNQYRMKQAAGRERKKLILFTDSHKRQDKIIIASYFG